MAGGETIVSAKRPPHRRGPTRVGPMPSCHRLDDVSEQGGDQKTFQTYQSALLGFGVIPIQSGKIKNHQKDQMIVPVPEPLKNPEYLPYRFCFVV